MNKRRNIFKQNEQNKTHYYLVFRDVSQRPLNYSVQLFFYFILLHLLICSWTVIIVRNSIEEKFSLEIPKAGLIIGGIFFQQDLKNIRVRPEKHFM